MEYWTILNMVGKVPMHIEISEDTLTFHFSDKTTAHFHHWQSCCEDVRIDDVNGDWADLIGTELLVAEERTGYYDDGGEYESVTWTFYTFRSIKGSVDVRWCGTSNGWYSESVDLVWSHTKK